VSSVLFRNGNIAARKEKNAEKEKRNMGTLISMIVIGRGFGTLTMVSKIFARRPNSCKAESLDSPKIS
jgi:hypothetical protein